MEANDPQTRAESEVSLISLFSRFSSTWLEAFTITNSEFTPTFAESTPSPFHFHHFHFLPPMVDFHTSSRSNRPSPSHFRQIAHSEAFENQHYEICKDLNVHIYGENQFEAPNAKLCQTLCAFASLTFLIGSRPDHQSKNHQKPGKTDFLPQQ